MPCFCCGEPLSSYGFPVIDGKERQVCITCENWKSRYHRGEMGTPNTFKVGDKVYGEYCRDWFPAVIYSIEVVKTPKGDMCHYLCYYEHHDCYDNKKEIIEDFGWFEYIKPRTDKAVKVDRDNDYNEFTYEYSKEPRKLGELREVTIPKKILDWIKSESEPKEEPQRQLTLIEMKGGSNTHGKEF
jgi:hypothetical protein